MATVDLPARVSSPSTRETPTSFAPRPPVLPANGERDELDHTKPGREAAQAWVLAFAEGWLAPASADAFADHFQPWFDPQVRLRQPLLPTLVGHQAFRERFARPLFELIPDLNGQVERFAIGSDSAYIELTLRGILGGHPIAWRACDRATLRDGLVVERHSYFDPTPLLRAILTRPRAWRALPRAWRALARARRRQRRRSSGTTGRRDAVAGARRSGDNRQRLRG